MKCIFLTEYAYGGHAQPRSGIFEITPRVAEELGEQFRYRYNFYFLCKDKIEKNFFKIKIYNILYGQFQYNKIIYYIIDNLFTLDIQILQKKIFQELLQS